MVNRNLIRKLDLAEEEWQQELAEAMEGFSDESFVESTQEVVIKPLSRFVRDSRYFSGSTIVGSGEVVLILDTGNLILSKRTYTAAKDAEEMQTVPALVG